MVDWDAEYAGRKACRLCAALLVEIRGQSGSEVSYQHRSQQDHDPDPVPVAAAASTRLVCDFCSEPDPIWAYPVSPPQGAAKPTFDVGDSAWSCCTTCAVLIDGQDRRGLLDRAVKRLRVHGGHAHRTLPMKMVTESIRQAHAQFWEKRPQPRVRLVSPR